MNANIARNNTAPWLRRSAVVVGTLLISGTLALGLSSRTSSTVAPAAPTGHWSAAAERFAAMKQAQAEARQPLANKRVAPTALSGQERFAAMKQAQAEARQPLAKLLPAAK